MRRLPLVAVLSLALAGCAAAGPRRLADAAALERALLSGHGVRAVVDYHRCTLRGEGGAPGGPGPDAQGGVRIDAFERFAAGAVGNPRPYLAASGAQLISHPRRGPVVDYVRLRFSEDGAVEVSARYLSAPALEVVMDETFDCRIAGPAGEGAVSLFEVP